MEGIVFIKCRQCSLRSTGGMKGTWRSRRWRSINPTIRCRGWALPMDNVPFALPVGWREHGGYGTIKVKIRLVGVRDGHLPEAENGSGRCSSLQVSNTKVGKVSNTKFEWCSKAQLSRRPNSVSRPYFRP